MNDIIIFKYDGGMINSDGWKGFEIPSQIFMYYFSNIPNTPPQKFFFSTLYTHCGGYMMDGYEVGSYE